jgi:molecular chaperone DnaJ
VFGDFVRTSTCPDCHGTGRFVDHPCVDCDGGGRRLVERTLEVDIPAGIHDGQRIRLSGEGHAGALGGRAGDVYVGIRVRPDERFVRVEAALGASVEVETLDGPMQVEFEPGTQPGETKTLRGRGMPVLQGHGRGDQRVLVNVRVPRRLSEEQRRLLGEFERASDAETYAKHDGFFDRLKSHFH